MGAALCNATAPHSNSDHDICTNEDRRPNMPRRAAIFQRIVQWVREQTSSGVEEERRRETEQRRQRLANELEINRRRRILNYNRWIERQRDIARRQTEGQGPSTNAEEGPIIYRTQLPQAPEALERVSQSLILIIRENGGRFRLDIVQVYDENGWHITFGVEVIQEQE